MAKGTENIRPKGVKIMLDRERHMRITFTGLEYLTEKYGDISTAFAAMQKSTSGLDRDSISAIIDFAYAGLMHEDRILTRSDVADMIDISMVNELAQAIAESVTGSMPKVEDSETPQ